MKKPFYSHLVKTDSLIVKINEFDLEREEKLHLLALVDSNLHYTVLDIILSELSEKDKKIFLMHLAYEEHDKLWEHLNKTVDKIEEKIKHATDHLIAKLHKDIKELSFKY